MKKMRTEDRLFSKVIKTDSCWQWSGYTTKAGYGRIRINDKMEYAHRVSYQLFINELEDGLEVLHTCNNPSCINPYHLRQGTHKENMEQMANENRHPFKNKTHCKQGHEYTEENTGKRTGGRYCKTCNRLSNAKSRGAI